MNRIFTIVALIALASCNDSGTDDLRAIPPANDLPPIAAGDFLPQPVSSGGGMLPLSKVLVGADNSAERDSADRPWVPSGVLPFVTPRQLGDAHFFFVLKPTVDENPAQGLLGGGTRPWSDFVQLSQAPGTGISLWTESPAGAWQRQIIAAAKSPEAQAPRLIEIHPTDAKVPTISINGETLGTSFANTNAAYFGVAYGAQFPFRGDVGEIRIYESPLTANQQSDIAQLLKSWWGLPGGIKSAFHPTYRDFPSVIGKSNSAATSGALTLRYPGDDMVFIAEGRADPLLPSEALTTCLGRRWRIQTHPATPEATTAGSTGTISFPQQTTLNAAHLGDKGFYVLLYRANDEQAWQEISTTSATGSGQINFVDLPIKDGLYTLAVVQGTIPSPLLATPVLED